MKVVITHLKAPWPQGASVGQVVDLPECDTVPAWAAGKCQEAPSDAEPAHTWTKPEPVEEQVVLTDAEKLAEAHATINQLRDQEQELLARVTKAEEALAARDMELTAARAALTKAEEALAAKAGGKTKA